MESDNPSGADDQQETAESMHTLDPAWVAGFVDGEGCFCVSVHRNAMMHRHGGWQLQLTFHVYQHQDHRDVLQAISSFFGCGRIRPKGPKSSVFTYSVESLRDIEEKILPFFERQRLLVKDRDFLAFAANRAVDAAKGTSDTMWVRGAGTSRLWYECQWEAACQVH